MSTKQEIERIKQKNLALLEEIANQEGLGEQGRIVLRKIMLVESDGQTTIKNPNSDALGLFQVIPKTWNRYADKYDDIDRTDSPKGDGRLNARQQILFAVRFTRDNERALTAALGGHPPTEGQLYKAHFLGLGGGNRDKGAIDVIKELEKNPSRPIKGFLPNFIFGPNSDVYLSFPDKKRRLYFEDFTVSDMHIWANRKMEQPPKYELLSDEARSRYRKDKGILDFLPDAFGDMQMSTMAMIAAAVVALIGITFSGGSSGSQSPSPTPSKGGGGRGFFS